VFALVERSAFVVSRFSISLQLHQLLCGSGAGARQQLMKDW